VPIGGEVKVVIPFTNPVIVGRFVYHCHILSHEDKRMMATIEVTPQRVHSAAEAPAVY
jgi:FtsP/CotA-like multicopper oxidase with cupredoxin domain